MNRFLWLAMMMVSGLGWVGCDRPCETTTQCGGGDVCAGARCQTLSCETPVLLRDPQSGACVPLSGCFLTDAQRGWQGCAEDPCSALAEASCVTDTRCQPVYVNPQLSRRIGDPTPDIACAGGGAPPSPRPNPNVAPGVHNGEAPKHAPPTSSGCVDPAAQQARAFMGCRPVPQVDKALLTRKSCRALTQGECGQRPDCQPIDQGGGETRPVPLPQPTGPDGPVLSQELGQCAERVSLNAPCESAGSAAACLMNPGCQPLGSKCYCPPGARCDCEGGAFLGCERNDHLRRCSSSAECGASERCDNDEACTTPRTFDRPQSVTPAPGSRDCVGACVPKGCAGYGERWCNDHRECDGGTYGTVCRPKAYCGRGDILLNFSESPDPSEGNCGCDAEFTGCGPQDPSDGIRGERSLLVRDPEIIDDPTFRIDQVLGRLAPAGKVDEFVRRWFGAYDGDKTLDNGALARRRMGVDIFLRGRTGGGAASLSAQALAGLFHTTSLVNRVDLATAADCGEARITFALNEGYRDGNQRMTVIVELGVPDDGKGCVTVAQRWAELSMIDDLPTRQQRLISLYTELLRPERLHQIRTNEFLNPKGVDPWELREWHLDQEGMLVLAPVKQTVAKEKEQSAELLAWVRQNQAAIVAGTAEVPAPLLGATSTENGQRVKLPADLVKAEKALNEASCAGCHLTETRSPFVHVGERLGKADGKGGYVPAGRAVIDEFMKTELSKRSRNLRALLTSASLMPAWRLTTTRTH